MNKLLVKSKFHTNPKYHVVWLARLENICIVCFCLNVLIMMTMTNVQNTTLVVVCIW